MTELELYSLSGYGEMIADMVRMEKYAAALLDVITPECTVLDIGTGAGIIALLACRFGAARVFAVEPSTVIQVGREVVESNGLSDRVIFVHGLSTALELQPRADVIVSDLRGVLPLFGHHIGSIVDARARLLATGGTLIPMRDEICCALVQSAAIYDEVVGPWTRHGLEFDMSAAQRRETSTWRRARIMPGELASTQQVWAEMDYRTVESPNFVGTMTWTCDREITLHGFGLWFNTELVPGIGFSNAPAAPRAIYGQAFFPFTNPINACAGDTIAIDLRATLVRDDYVWAWETHHATASREGRTVTLLRQNSLNAMQLSTNDLRRRSDSFVPTLDDDAQIDQLILSSIDGFKSNGEISRVVQQAFPQRFPSWQDALGRVTDWSAKLKAPAISAPATV